MTSNAVMILGAALTALVVLYPGLLRSQWWRATVTPLASIIGSGFLVVGPILAHVAGGLAWLAMSALCALAYLFGTVIRHNIAHAEPLLAENKHRGLLALERASDYALAFAYFVSVAYYLNLFGAFALKGLGIVDPYWTRSVSTAAIVALGLVGSTRGLRAMEHVELAAVGIKLAMIGGLLSALLWADALAAMSATLALPSFVHSAGAREIGILLGLVILVQGFETSRFLGQTYDAPLRIRTMRLAQLISSAIYVCFILLVTPYFTGALPAAGGETGIIDMLKPLGSVVGPLIILAALASQLSAAIADMNGAGGLLWSASRKAVPVRTGYFITACFAVLITWSASIFEIIVYASKAFVLYYGLQSIEAAVIAAGANTPYRMAKSALFVAAAAAALAVMVFGLAVEGG